MSASKQRQRKSTIYSQNGDDSNTLISPSSSELKDVWGTRSIQKDPPKVLDPCLNQSTNPEGMTTVKAASGAADYLLFPQTEAGDSYFSFRTQSYV